MEKLDYLINYLLEENSEVKIDEIPKEQESKKRLYRSLCNIREPKQISKEYLQAEDEYLKDELKEKQITKVENIKTVFEKYGEVNLKNKNKICLWQGDITTLQIDAIVNAANSQGLGCFIPCHKCIDNQINSFAGIRLRLECNKIMKQKNYNLKTSEVIITNGYNLPAKYIIHTVGPIIYNQVTEIEESQLAKCYQNCLELAIKNNIKTIAFPCISTGEFRFPKELACQIAVKTVDEFLTQNSAQFDKVVFNVYKEEDLKLYERYVKSN